MILGNLTVFLPVTNESLFPLPLAHVHIAGREGIEYPVGRFVSGHCLRKTGDESDACHTDLFGQHTGVAELPVVVLNLHFFSIYSS